MLARVPVRDASVPSGVTMTQFGRRSLPVRDDVFLEERAITLRVLARQMPMTAHPNEWVTWLRSPTKLKGVCDAI